MPATTRGPATVGPIWVVAEADPEAGRPLGVTLELLTAARRLGARVVAWTWGPGGAGAAAELGRFGASRVVELGDLGPCLPGVAVAAALAEAVLAGGGPDGGGPDGGGPDGGGPDGGGPDAVLVPATYDGRDIAGRLSARLDRPLLANVVDLEVQPADRPAGGDGSQLVSTHAVFGGTHLVRARFTGRGPGIFVVRPKSFAAEPAGGADPAQEAAPEVVAVAVPELGRAGSAVVADRHVEPRTGPPLDEAAVVVAGGRGLGGADRFEMIEELARLLHAAPAASRAIVDAGWVPYSYQVGQTGKTVKPAVYLAFGISGATQHMVGMKGARSIVAVNKDANAPIFAIADLGVVGDVHKVLPKLIEALKARP